MTALSHKINVICINMLFYLLSAIKKTANKYGICSVIG